MRAKRVLVTGASGFVGQQTIAPLLARGWDVHAVGRTVISDRASWYRANLLDQVARRQLLAAVRPDAVLHCAWVTQPGEYWTSPANLDWTSASLDLVRAAVELGARRFLVPGSCAEYDWTVPASRPWREDDPIRPSSVYGTAKDSLHRLLAAYSAQAGFSLVWARLFHLYGPHEKPDRFVPSLLECLRSGRRIETGPGEALRDFMHVEDAGRALAHLMGSEVVGAFNVASGRPVTIRSVSETVGRLAGRPDLLAVGARPSHEPVMLAADVTRLAATGFRCSIMLDDGLAALWSSVPTPVAAAPDYDRAASHYRAGRHDAARVEAEAVLRQNPDHAPTLNLLGVLHRQRGALAAAKAVLERAALLDPDRETAWVNLGNVLLDLEDGEAAAAAYERALAAAPGRTDTLRVLGNALARAGRDADAMVRFDAAVGANPDAMESRRDRARAHFMAGRVDAALADLESAIARHPEDVELAMIRAQMLRLSGHAAEAMAILRELAARAGDNPDVQVTLGDALLAEEKREEANSHYRRAVALRAGDESSMAKLCWCLLNSRYGNEAANIAEAASIARRMVSRGTLHPAGAHAVQSALLRVADLEGLAAFDALFPDRGALFGYWVRRNVIGALHAQLGRVSTLEDRLTLIDCHRDWGARYEARTHPIRTARAPVRERIRVGFMSSDLRHHPVSYFALPIFELYDKARFEIFAYSFYPGAPDQIQQAIAGQVSGFRTMPNMPERDIAERIAADRLDILFELGGSTHLNRLEVMAHQPAPVQVSWLGYPHSSGLSRIGHILVDPYLKPPDPRLLLETPMEMPSSWVCLGRLGFDDHPILPGLPEDRAGRLTFGTMNNPYKYAPEAIRAWARVLARLPESRFLIVRPEAGTALFRENMSRAFAAHGIAAGRLAFAPVRGTHMKLYNEIDIALDTLPQTGGTTTCESLWMGVPTVSLLGAAFFERLSYSNLSNVGLGDLVARTPDAYVETAVALAGDRDRRQALRGGLRDAVRTGPLGDRERWVRDFQQVIKATLGQG